MEISKINEEFLKIIKCEDFFKAPEKILQIVKDKEKQNEIYPQILSFFNFQMGIDWFNELFQHEYAEQKRKNQHFTPQSVAKLITSLAKDTGTTRYEATCGTGQLIITKWFDDVINDGINYKPQKYAYVCEELSERTIPFLLLNLSIRGINAIVMQGDALERKYTKKFIVYNKNNQYMDFSEVMECKNC